LQVVVSSSLAMFLIFFAGAIELDWTRAFRVEELVAKASAPEKTFEHTFGTLRAAQVEQVTPLPPIALPDRTLDENAVRVEAALVLDPATQTVLFEKKRDKRWPIASITKLVTASVLLDVRDQSLSLPQPITVQESDIKEGPLYFSVGDVVAWDDAFRIMLVGSSNSAVEALVRATGLSTERWQKLVIDKLGSWGLQKTQLGEPSGLSAGDISTPYEVATIFEHALERKEIFNALSTPSFSYTPLNGKKAVHVGSTNLFLSGNLSTNFTTPPIGKTGFIDEAGYNLVALVKGPQGQQLVAVVLGAQTHFDRFTEMEKIATWALNSYQWPAFEEKK
jgi:D-alanyl-D-alanine carboxypeptidase